MIKAQDFQPTKLLIPPQEHSETQLERLSSLKKCNTIEEFKQVHGHFIKVGLFHNRFYSTSLTNTCALSNWGNMSYACSIFRQIENPGNFEYNAMITGYVKDLDFRKGLSVFVEMLWNGLIPDNFTYPSALKACSGLFATQEGSQIHGQVFKLGFQDDVFVQNSLISFYGKCGKLQESCFVFGRIEHKTVASWSAIIASHVKKGMWKECINVFEEMNRTRNWVPEESILVNLISCCTNFGAFDLGRSVHGYLLRHMRSLNVIVEASLIDMYIKCGSLEKGLLVFKRMGERNRRSYSVVISGLGLHGRGKHSLRIFSKMIENGLNPDDVLGVLSACRNAGLVKEGIRIFDEMKMNHALEPNIQHYGCIVDLLGKSGKIKQAIDLVNSMPMKPNDVVWRSLMSASRVHHNVEVGELSAGNLITSKSDNAGDYVTLANIYARAEMWEDLAKARKMMHSKGLNKEPGFCLVEVKRRLHKFVSQDMSHPKTVEIHETIHQMEWQLKFEGYEPDLCEVLLDVDEVEKRERLRYHSQKLALAYGLMS